ncbi:MAG: hypothetical protein WCC82_08285, partial [Nitrososphaeraceae archaeon]
LEARNILYRNIEAMNKPSKSGIYDLEIRVILGMIYLISLMKQDANNIKYAEKLGNQPSRYRGACSLPIVS